MTRSPGEKAPGRSCEPLTPRALGSPILPALGGLEAARSEAAPLLLGKNTSPSGADNEGFISTDMFIVKEALDHNKCLSHYKGGEGGREGSLKKGKVLTCVTQTRNAELWTVNTSLPSRPGAGTRQG